MTPLAILSIESLGDQFSRGRSSHKMPRKSTDVKIQDQIMPRIALSGCREGSLLASATAPQVVIDASHTKHDPECFACPYHHRPQKRPNLLAQGNQFLLKYYPIGLHRYELHNWINALMQFMLFIPLLREIFSYTPPSFRPFNEFIDQYFCDLEEQYSISRSNSRELVHCLLGKFPQLFRNLKKICLYDLIQAISRSACAFTSFDHAGFRAEWQILWDSTQELSLEEIFTRPSTPPELLVALQPSIRKSGAMMTSQIVSKQYFYSRTAICYDLDAFIEHRMEEGGLDCYFTYLKVEGGWVQCADERIVPLRRSTFLDLPLGRGVLFHYRRAWMNLNT